MLPAIQTPYEPEVRYMERALELAELAAAEGEVPVGAVVVHKPTGAIIGEGYNRREAAKSPSPMRRFWRSGRRAGRWADGVCCRAQFM